MEIRPATKQDTLAIAELALMAGEGIPAVFWAQSQRPGEDIVAVGARNALSENENFSYRNVLLALLEGEIAGMMLAYRLPSAEAAQDLKQFPEFIRPLIALEQCVPESYYINMIATYPKYRNQGVGSALMARVDTLARKAGCTTSSIEVFEENSGALRLYQRLGYRVIETRQVVEHPCQPHRGNVLLLIRKVQ